MLPSPSTATAAAPAARWHNDGHSWNLNGRWIGWQYRRQIAQNLLAHLLVGFGAGLNRFNLRIANGGRCRVQIAKRERATVKLVLERIRQVNALIEWLIHSIRRVWVWPQRVVVNFRVRRPVKSQYGDLWRERLQKPVRISRHLFAPFGEVATGARGPALKTLRPRKRPAPSDAPR